MQIEGFRLSPLQRRIWGHHYERSGPFRALGVMRIRGRLDRTRLESAISGVVDESEILRTFFAEVPGLALPVQVIAEGVDEALEDAGATPGTGFEAFVDARNRELSAGEALTLGDVPHFSARLTSWGSDEHALAVELSSMCGDAAGVGLLLDAIARSYGAGGAAADVPDGDREETLQYADISEWLIELVEGEDGDAGRAFWRKVGLEDPRARELPFGPSGSLTDSFAIDTLDRQVDRAVAEGLARVAEELDAPLEDVLTGAFKVLLWRLGGEQDVTIGLRCSGRRYEELADAQGLFDNYVPLSMPMQRDDSFGEVTRTVSRVRREIEERQEFFDWDLFESGLEESGRIRCFPVCFQVDEYPTPVQVGDTSFQVASTHACIDRFGVLATCAIRDGGVSLALSFDRNAYASVDMARLLDQFDAVLAATVAGVDAAIGSIECLGASERESLIVDFNDTTAEYPTDTTLDRLFSSVVRASPEVVAVVDGDESVTYHEVDMRANQLASYLRSVGVGPEVLVAICLDRSIEMIVAVLAVLKAGGAYVPLDPRYPQDRSAFVLEDTAAPVLITRSDLVGLLPAFAGESVLMDGHSPAIEAVSSDPVEPTTGEANAAYVIYTSGSTGRPKGVVVEHRNAVHSTTARFKVFDGPVERFLLLASFSFDSSVAGIFWTLCQGGTLVLPEPETEQDPKRIVACIEKHGITHLTLLASLYKTVLEAASTDDLQSLRVVYVAGEACSSALTRAHLERLPSAAFYNAYGPTEGTVWSTVYRVERPVESGRVPIGRPIPNVTAYVLDEAMVPVPTGVSGEVYIGGAGVARGYLNRPDVTAERFVSDPLSKGGRLYRTGDLARHRADGTLEFMGRVDDQVKVRGFRIELGEIEAALVEHADVLEAAVAARLDEDERDDGAGARRLVAYLVTRSGGVDSEEIRKFLGEKLPEYMVPAILLALNELPRLPNGKVDRGALPAPSDVRPDLSVTYVAPRNAAEEILAGIWGELLRVDKVGVNDNFFQLGGDSILSIQAVARAGQQGLRLTPMMVFEHQTIASLAEVAGKGKVISAEQGEVTGPVPLTPVQHWLFEQDVANPSHFNMPLLVETLRPIGVDALTRAADALVSHHDVLRLRFRKDSEGWTQTLVPSEGRSQVESVDVSALSDEARAQEIESVSTRVQASLDIEHGPLMSIVVFDCGEGRPGRLLWVIHHMAVDVVTWQILLEDLQSCLQQIQVGSEMRLPPKTSSFKVWAERLEEFANSDQMSGEADYWAGQLDADGTALPLDRQNGSNEVPFAETVSVTLDERKTTALLREVPRAYDTQINEILLTAFTRAVTAWTEAPAVVVELEGHGREDLFDDLDISRTAGWFTSSFPVRLSVEAGVDPGDAIKGVKSVLRAIPRRGIGYGILRYLSSRDELVGRMRSATPPTVSFNYMGQFDQALPGASPFRLASESMGPDRAPEGERTHILEAYGWVVDGCLKIEWVFSRDLHDRFTIEGVANAFITELEALVEHCVAVGAGSGAGVGLEELDWDAGDIDDVMGAIKRAQKGA